MLMVGMIVMVVAVVAIVVVVRKEFVGDFQVLAVGMVCFVFNNCHRISTKARTSLKNIRRERGGEGRVRRTSNMRRRSATRRRRRTRIEEMKIAIDFVGATVPSVEIK